MQASLEGPEGISTIRSRLQRKGPASGPFLIYCNPGVMDAQAQELPQSPARRAEPVRDLNARQNVVLTARSGPYGGLEARIAPLWVSKDERAEPSSD